MPWSFVKFSQLIISVVACIQKPPPTLLFRGGGGEGGGFTQVRSITIGDKSFYQKKWTAENELTISFVGRLHDVMHSEKRLTLVFEYCDQVRQRLIVFYTHSIKKWHHLESAYLCTVPLKTDLPRYSHEARVSSLKTKLLSS